MEKLNITFKSIDPIASILSNLARTPFSYGGYTFTSVESALQGIKIKDKQVREKVFKMKGMRALKIGRVITMSITENKKQYVYWNNKKIIYNSQDHRLLIAAFIREKVRQSPVVQNALIKTKGKFVYHDAGFEHPHTSLPEKLFIEILLAERKILLKLLSLK